MAWPFPKWYILDSSNFKEFEDNNVKFYENGKKFSKLKDTKHYGRFLARFEKSK